MLKSAKLRWLWFIYLCLQIVGLFHLFSPLPAHYRHSIGRFFILPLLPGGPIAMTADWYIHGYDSYGQITMKLLDKFLIGALTLAINCGLFALIAAVVLWSIRIRRNSWRANANTFD